MLQNLPEDVIERELSRAINKTDFFRAFRMLANHYGFSGFLVLDLSGYTDQTLVSGLCLIADLPAESFARFGAMKVVDNAAVLAELADLRKPVVDHHLSAEFAQIMPGERTIALPSVTVAGEKYVLLVGDPCALRDEAQIASIIFDFSSALRRFGESDGRNAEPPKFRKCEIEVIEWTAEGKTSADIAIILGLSEYTVNEYIASATKKLDALNRIHLVTKAIRLGIIT